MSKRSRGDMRAFLQTFDIDAELVNGAIDIFNRRMTINFPRTPLKQKQLCLICLLKAVNQKKNRVISINTLGSQLGLTSKQIDSARLQFTNMICGYDDRNDIKEVSSVEDYLRASGAELHWDDEQIDGLIQLYQSIKIEKKFILHTNANIAAGFLHYFLKKRGTEIPQSELIRITQSTMNKIDMVRKMIEEIVNQDSDEDE